MAMLGQVSGHVQKHRSDFAKRLLTATMDTDCMRFRGPLLIVSLALVWGANFLWIKIGLAAFGPFQLTFGRVALGAALLLVVVAVRWERLPRDAATWGHLTVAALVGNAV